MIAVNPEKPLTVEYENVKLTIKSFTRPERREYFRIYAQIVKLIKSKKEETQEEGYALCYELLNKGILNWEGMKNKIGEDMPFPENSISEENFVVTDYDMIGMIAKILEVNGLTKVEEKNS